MLNRALFDRIIIDEDENVSVVPAEPAAGVLAHVNTDVPERVPAETTLPRTQTGQGFAFLNLRGAMGIRTPDLLHAMQALYQLSYSPVPRRSLAVDAGISLAGVGRWCESVDGQGGGGVKASWQAGVQNHQVRPSWVRDGEWAVMTVMPHTGSMAVSGGGVRVPRVRVGRSAMSWA